MKRAAPSSRPSLRARALQWLAQREHSRQELRRKLLGQAALDAAAQDRDSAPPRPGARPARMASSPADGPAAGSPYRPQGAARPEEDADAAAAPPATFERASERRAAAVTPEVVEQVDALLDWLEAGGYLSDARFVESRVRAREARLGTQRIRHELARHGAALPATVVDALKASEASRAAAVWQRKFGEPAADAAGRAKQMRFLAARGFDPEVIRRVVPAARRSDVAEPDDA